MTSASDRLSSALAGSADALTAVRRRTDLAAGVRDQVGAITATAQSPAGDVSATVDAGGMLTRLDISTTAYSRHTAASMAELVTSTVQQATAQARTRMREALRGLEDEDRVVPVLFPRVPAVQAAAPRSRPRPEEQEEEDQPLRRDAW